MHFSPTRSRSARTRTKPSRGNNGHKTSTQRHSKRSLMTIHKKQSPISPSCSSAMTSITIQNTSNSITVGSVPGGLQGTSTACDNTTNTTSKHTISTSQTPTLSSLSSQPHPHPTPTIQQHQNRHISTTQSLHQRKHAVMGAITIGDDSITDSSIHSTSSFSPQTHSTPSSSHTNGIEMMGHSPVYKKQDRGFQTRYNTPSYGSDGGINTPYNTPQDSSNDGLTSYNTQNNKDQKGVYTSSHFKLTRETMVAYLTRKNLTFKHSGDKTIIMECPLCPKPTYGKPDNLWKLCLFDNGAFVCLRCQSKGSWYDFKSQLGDLPNITNMAGKPIYQQQQQIESKAFGINDDGADENMKYIREQQEEYKQLSQMDCEKMVENLDQSPLILDWFENTRKIKRETLVKYKVGSTKQKFPQLNPTTRQVEWIENECMSFPWTDRKSATDDNNVLYQRVKVRSLLEKKNMRLLPKGGTWGFFGWHTVPIQSKQLIVTEGELDAMSVWQATGLPAISLPNGANSLPPALLPALERFEKITLWLDDDQAGHAAVESMTQKLGVGRTYHIPGGYGAKDANEALQKGLNIGSIIETATRQQHKQISTFQSFRHEVKRMFYDPNTQVGIQYPNMPILQSLIKGHRRGELTILTGGTGVGKTTLLTQLSLELASQGVNTLWGSFEIRNPRLAKTLMKQYAAVLGVVLNEQHPEAFDYIADKFEELPFNFLKFYGSSPVQEVIEAMEYATYVHDVQHIILDNLQFMLSGQGRGTGDKFDIQDRAIEAFRQFASQRNVHVTLVIHPRKEQDNSSLGLASVFGSAKATQEADNVMIIQGGLPRTVLRNIQLPDSEGGGKKTSTQLKQGTGNDLGQHGGFEDPIIGEIMGTFFRTIELRKNRWDGDLGSVPLRFDKSSSRFYELTSDDISLGLGEFISKQKKLKQLDLIKHMNQLPGSPGLKQSTRSGFDDLAQSPGDSRYGGNGGNNNGNEKYKAKMQASRALADHFSSGNLNSDAQREIKNQYSDKSTQDAMNQGASLSPQQEMELQRQFDQMFGLGEGNPGVNNLQSAMNFNSSSGSNGDDEKAVQQQQQKLAQMNAAIAFGSPQAMAIRNLEDKMLNEMADEFEGTNTSTGNLQNHPKFQQLQHKQQQFQQQQQFAKPSSPFEYKKPEQQQQGSTTNANVAKEEGDTKGFKKHTAPVGYTPTLDIVFE